MEYGFLTAHNQGVTRIVAALEPDYDIGPFGEPIDNFALTFVPPLRAYYYNICHIYLFPTSLSGAQSKFFSFALGE